jgi:hypothetical protein
MANQIRKEKLDEIMTFSKYVIINFTKFLNKNSFNAQYETIMHYFKNNVSPKELVL